VRDTVEDMVDEAIDPDGDIEIKDVVVQAATLETCDPDHDERLPRASDFPFTPTPPPPPVPPAP